MEETNNYFVLQGGPENLTWFAGDRFPTEDGQAFFWTVPKAAKRGDRAFIYLTAPVSAIVGEVEIVNDPFENLHNMFENNFMAGKRCAEVALRRSFARRSHLTMRFLRARFSGEWKWLSYPRGSVHVPENFRGVLLEHVNRRSKL